MAAPMLTALDNIKSTLYYPCTGLIKHQELKKLNTVCFDVLDDIFVIDLLIKLNFQMLMNLYFPLLL